MCLAGVHSLYVLSLTALNVLCQVHNDFLSVIGYHYLRCSKDTLWLCNWIQKEYTTRQDKTDAEVPVTRNIK